MYLLLCLPPIFTITALYSAVVISTFAIMDAIFSLFLFSQSPTVLVPIHTTVWSGTQGFGKFHKENKTLLYLLSKDHVNFRQHNRHYCTYNNTIPSYQHTILLTNFCSFSYLSKEIHESITYSIWCDDVADVNVLHHKKKKKKRRKMIESCCDKKNQNSSCPVKKSWPSMLLHKEK